MHFPQFTRVRAAIVLLVAAALIVVFFPAVQRTSSETSLGEFAKENHLNIHSQALATVREKLESGAESISGPSQEAYANRALPRNYVAYEQAIGAAQAHEKATLRPSWARGVGAWTLTGPKEQTVPDTVTYTGRASTVSGRTTALAVSHSCVVGDCRAYLGAAGGGIWRTHDILATAPAWTYVGSSLASNAIGSIVIDPLDAKGRVVYAGTGEPNGSSDSEAGVGLYKSVDFGQNWTLVPGSVAAAKDRSIAGIAVDPVNPRHIVIGTALARHGSSSVNGGRFTPPNAPALGLYESKDGGATFNLVFSKPADPVVPTSPNGSDFFRGGVSKVLFSRTGLKLGQPSVVYFSVFDYGLYRSASAGTFEQVFASAGQGLSANSAGSRTEFALAPNGKDLRIYLGDTSGAAPANLYRVDSANTTPAATLTDGVNNPGWTNLSNPTPGTPGYASYNYCGGQCSYDMPVASPPGQPDTVWIGGQMQYGEIFTAHQPSNGRAVQRSTDAGASFTDMTNDTQSPPLGMHPDQHAITFIPGDPNIALVASDGGVIRNSSQFADASAQCATRGISGADLVDCQMWLKAIPVRLYPLNDGLSTLQFQSVSLNPQNPKHDLLGGTQDNGTWAFNGRAGNGFESVGGDGGQSGIDVGNPNIRIHSYYNPQHDVNFQGNQPTGWDWVSDPLLNSGEKASFYTPLKQDPKVSGTIFDGLQHVWRTQDSGGPQAYLDATCNEFTGTFAAQCGDWVPLGQDLTSTTFGSDKAGNYVVAIERSTSDTGTLWAATRRGRLFISKNADAANAASVQFTRLDTVAQPQRFISGIAIEPANPNHAYISYSGYNAYTPTTPGHVFEVTYDPSNGAATFKDLSYDLGDQPITGLVRDDATGSLYASTDFGVLQLASGATSWAPAAQGLPKVAVYGLTISSSARVLYAATHGRSVWKLDLPAATR